MKYIHQNAMKATIRDAKFVLFQVFPSIMLIVAIVAVVWWLT